MKVGDKIPVNIGSHVVGEAEIKEISDGQAVLIVPARRVVMGIRSELTDLPTNDSAGKQVLIDEVVRQETSTPPVVEQPVPSTPATAVEPATEAPVPPTQNEVSPAAETNNSSPTEASNSDD